MALRDGSMSNAKLVPWESSTPTGRDALRDWPLSDTQLVPWESYFVTLRVRPLRDRCRAGSYGSRTQHTSPFTTKGGCTSRDVTAHPRRYARVGASIARPRNDPPNMEHADANSYPVGFANLHRRVVFFSFSPRTANGRPYTRIRTRREDGARTGVRTYGTF